MAFIIGETKVSSLNLFELNETKSLSIMKVSRKSNKPKTVKRAYLISLSEYVFAYNLEKKIIYEKKTICGLKPKIYPKNYETFFAEPISEFPEVYLTSIENAHIRNNSALIYTNGFVVVHDLIDSEADLIAEEKIDKNMFLTFNENGQHYLDYVDDNLAEINVEEAILFTDRCAFNYAHWTTETLPKIFVINEYFSDDCVTLIVNNSLHPNILDSIRFFVKKHINIIVIDKDTKINVEKLHVISPVGYIPFENRKLQDNDPRWNGVFSPDLIQQYRQNIINNTLLKKNTHIKRKLFIKRNSYYRILENQDDIASKLALLGFEIIEPERLTLLEQMAYFSNADIIISQSGAALANLVYCKPATRIFILISETVLPMVGYWNQVSRSSQNLLKINYIVGKSNNIKTRLNLHDYHYNFVVDFELIEKLLKEY